MSESSERKNIDVLFVGTGKGGVTRFEIPEAHPMRSTIETVQDEGIGNIVSSGRYWVNLILMRQQSHGFDTFGVSFRPNPECPGVEQLNVWDRNTLEFKVGNLFIPGGSSVGEIQEGVRLGINGLLLPKGEKILDQQIVLALAAQLRRVGTIHRVRNKLGPLIDFQWELKNILRQLDGGAHLPPDELAEILSLINAGGEKLITNSK